MEIARAGGERLLDTLASSELAGRLMALERERLVSPSSKPDHILLGHQARRALHDEILPLLHAAMLTLGTGPSQQHETPSTEALEQIAEVYRRLTRLLHELPASSIPELGKLGLVGALRRLLDRYLAATFDGVDWQLEPAAEQLARELPPLTAEVLYDAAREAIRNAARHARNPDQPLQLTVSLSEQPGTEPDSRVLAIEIDDNGIGLRAKQPVAGGGAGLALHSTLMAVVGGTLALNDRPSGGTSVTLRWEVRRS